MSANQRRHKLNKLLPLVESGEVTEHDLCNHLIDMSPKEIAGCIMKWYRANLIHEAKPRTVDPMLKLEKRVLYLEEKITRHIQNDIDRRNFNMASLSAPGQI